jgi:hypothetical protein
VSHVDAKNAFGVTLRTRYQAVIKYAGNDTWTAESVRFVD